MRLLIWDGDSIILDQKHTYQGDFPICVGLYLVI